jgi:hypothetical protein
LGQVKSRTMLGVPCYVVTDLTLSQVRENLADFFVIMPPQLDEAIRIGIID